MTRDAQVHIMVMLMHAQIGGLVFGDHNLLLLLILEFLAATCVDPE